jgi:hypothetical protein
MLEQIDLAIGFAVVMLVLSLMVTVIVQAIAAMLDLRGRNLVWGITKLLHHVDPEFEQTAKRDWNEIRSTVGKKIAEAVAQHPSIAHSWLGRATAVRLDELIKILRDVAKRPPDDLTPAALEKLKAWTAEAPPNPTALAAANMILSKVESKIPTHTAEVKRIIDQVVGTGGKLEAGIREWFDTVMDRSTDAFARYTKIITVLVTVVLAFGLHIDSGNIVHQISSNPEIRGKLTEAADQTLKKADQIMNEQKRGTAALAAFRDKHKGDPIALILKQPLPDLAKCQDATQWLSEHGGNADLVKDLASSCQDEVADNLKQAQASFNEIRTDLDKTGLRILTADFPRTLSWSGLGHFLERSYEDSARLPGVICTAILVSLGAPFWYNALRQLASLKPAIAQRIKKEESSAESKG